MGDEMTGRLTGQKCVVTGAAQGIGRATAERFLREGAVVVAVDRNAEALATFGAEPNVVLETADVTDAAGLERIAQAHPDSIVLVNCAGIVAGGTVLDCEPDELTRILEVNVGSIHRAIRAFLPAMLERRRGSIINIASVVSSVKAAPDRFAYATSKAAVIGLTKSVARDFIAHGIRCNAISPGTVDSPSLASRMAMAADPVAARAAFLERQPMGRLGTVEEIAAVATLLASDEAAFMTGENIVIDGGMSL